MDLVNIIIAVMAVAAAGCAIALAWPAREPRARDAPVTERDGTRTPERSTDGG